MTTKLEKLFNDFKSVYKSDFELSETKWWKIDTSVFLILETFKESIFMTDSKTLSLFPYEDKFMLNMDFNDIKNIKNINESIANIKDFRKTHVTHKPKSFGAIHQYLRVGIIFGVIKSDFLSIYQMDSNQKLIDDIISKKVILEFDESFINSPNVTEYLSINWRSVFENQLYILKSKFKSIAEDTNKLMFSHYIYLQNEYQIITDNEALNIFREIKAQVRTDYATWYEEAKMQRMSTSLLKPVFDVDKDTSDLEKGKVIENGVVGYIGERIFNYYAKDKARFLNKIRDYKNELSQIEYGQRDMWVSNFKPYSPYDFQLDDHYFEVKTSKKQVEKKISFQISDNEIEHIKEYPETSYICRISNIDYQKLGDIYLSDENDDFLKVAFESIFEIVKYSDITNEERFSMKSKGYFVNEK